MKLKYGVFLDRRIEMDWDSMLIGASAIISRMKRDNAETADFEYYYKENGRTFIVKNPTIAEAAIAKMTRTTGKYAVGYRKESQYVENTKELKKILDEMSSSSQKQM